MKNVKFHTINFPSTMMEVCWDVYSHRYKHIEISFDKSYCQFNLYKNNIHSSGAFQLPINKFQSLEESFIKNYFVSENSRIITFKTKVLLRGLAYYPGLLKLENTEKLKWIFRDIKDILEVYGKIEDTENIILYLALLDNLKNLLFILFNALEQSLRYLRGNDLRDSFKKRDYFNMISLIEEVELMFCESFVTRKIKLDKKLLTYNETLNKVKALFDTYLYKLDKNPKIKQDLIRRVRECNNPYKLMNFAERLANYYLPADTLIVGFAYGAIELPFVVNALREIKGKVPLPQAVIYLSNYSTENSDYVQDLNDTLSTFYSENFFKKFQNILILDDSVTTGRTIENLINLLPNSIENIYLGFVSFKGSNRYHHVTRPYHGGINPYVLKNSFVAFEGNYAKTYTKKSYTNRQGVFDIEKAKLMKLINSYYSKHGYSI